MDTVITFTPAQLVAGILAIFAAISCAAAAFSWIAKGHKVLKAPEVRQNERLTALERRVAQHDEFLAKDKRRIEAIEEGHRVTQRAILALLAHGIDGNDVEEMKKAKADLQQYLINR